MSGQDDKWSNPLPRFILSERHRLTTVENRPLIKLIDEVPKFTKSSPDEPKQTDTSSVWDNFTWNNATESHFKNNNNPAYCQNQNDRNNRRRVPASSNTQSTDGSSETFDQNQANKTIPDQIAAGRQNVTAYDTHNYEDFTIVPTIETWNLEKNIENVVDFVGSDMSGYAPTPKNQLEYLGATEEDPRVAGSLDNLLPPARDFDVEQPTSICQKHTGPHVEAVSNLNESRRLHKTRISIEDGEERGLFSNQIHCPEDKLNLRKRQQKFEDVTVSGDIQHVLIATTQAAVLGVANLVDPLFIYDRFHLQPGYEEYELTRNEEGRKSERSERDKLIENCAAISILARTAFDSFETIMREQSMVADLAVVLQIVQLCSHAPVLEFTDWINYQADTVTDPFVELPVDQIMVTEDTCLGTIVFFAAWLYEFVHSDEIFDCMASTGSTDKYTKDVVYVSSLTAKWYAIEQWRALEILINQLNLPQKQRIWEGINELLEMNIKRATAHTCGMSLCLNDQSLVSNGRDLGGESNHCGYLWVKEKVEKFAERVAMFKQQAGEFDVILRRTSKPKSSSDIYDCTRYENDIGVEVHSDELQGQYIVDHGLLDEEYSSVAKRYKHDDYEAKTAVCADVSECLDSKKPIRMSQNFRHVPGNNESLDIPEEVHTSDGRGGSGKQLANPQLTYDIITEDEKSGKRRKNKPVEKMITDSKIMMKPIPMLAIRLSLLCDEVTSKPSATTEYMKDVVGDGLTLLETCQPEFQNLGAAIALTKSLRHQLVPRLKDITTKFYFPTGSPDEIERKLLAAVVIILGSNKFQSTLRRLDTEIKKTVASAHYPDSDWLAPIQLKALLNHISSRYHLPSLRLGIAIKEFAAADRCEADEEKDVKNAMDTLPFEQLGGISVHPRYVRDTIIGLSRYLRLKPRNMQNEITIWIGCTKFLEYQGIGKLSSI